MWSAIQLIAMTVPEPTRNPSGNHGDKGLFLPRVLVGVRGGRERRGRRTKERGQWRSGGESRVIRWWGQETAPLWWIPVTYF